MLPSHPTWRKVCIVIHGWQMTLALSFGKGAWETKLTNWCFLGVCPASLLKASQTLSVIAYLLLCGQIVKLKAEQYHLVKPERTCLTHSKRRLAVHLLSLLLLAAFAVAVSHAALLGIRDARSLYFAFVVSLLVFLGLILGAILSFPHENHEIQRSTALFLLLMVSSTN